VLTITRARIQDIERSGALAYVYTDVSWRHESQVKGWMAFLASLKPHGRLVVNHTSTSEEDHARVKKHGNTEYVAMRSAMNHTKLEKELRFQTSRVGRNGIDRFLDALMINVERLRRIHKEMRPYVRGDDLVIRTRPNLVLTNMYWAKSTRKVYDNTVVVSKW